jgi:hypothetical protein
MKHMGRRRREQRPTLRVRPSDPTVDLAYRAHAHVEDPETPSLLPRGAPVQAPLARSSTRLMSIRTPGPMVEETDRLRT